MSTTIRATSGGATRTTITTPTDLEIAMICVVDASPELVFEAWTKPQHVSQWMLGTAGWTMPVCEINLRPGGAWHFVWRRAQGSQIEMRGEYREVTPPRRLVSSETWGFDWLETMNTLELSETADGTAVRQTVLFPTRAARDEALKTGMTEGVSETFNRLATYVRAMACA